MSVRTTPPSGTNKYYIHYNYKGYNRCILIKGTSCLPNCVGYAYGRYMEMAGVKSCNLPTCNAEDWYSVAKSRGFKVGKTPKVGAVICWSKGRTGNSKDGCGHVAVVERVYADGSILVSESGYGCTKRMWNDRFKSPYRLAGYTFLGFIYNPNVRTSTYKGKMPTVLIKRGSKGEDVKAWQEYINWYYDEKVLTVDGNFGGKTERVTEDIQSENGLKVDGKVGKATRTAALKIAR